ncbi:MAG: ABC transporter ATP-binding protein, partial [Planctomycetota bacterium]|nr:ABC transporter ATP-binding protein [Planctomycetota bacterium]
SNVLVMDEPTNDLDAETLDLLEEVLLEYSGTVLLVSHDREFLNNVVTSTLVFEGQGEVHDYAGGSDDWLVQRSKTLPDDPPKPDKSKPEKWRKKPAERRLTYKEKIELETLPPRIEALETKQRRLHAEMADPAFYQQDRQSIVARTAELETVDRQLAEAYARWEELEGIGG